MDTCASRLCTTVHAVYTGVVCPAFCSSESVFFRRAFAVYDHADDIQMATYHWRAGVVCFLIMYRT